jgi:hypothetical protein
MDRYDPERDVSTTFLTTVARWISMTGEVFVVLRYLRGSGSKDVAFCRNAEEFSAMVRASPTGCDIVVFRNPQLTLRGIVDDALAEKVMNAIRDGDEYCLASLARKPGTMFSSCWRMGDRHVDLRGDLDELRGQQIACGPLPDFNAPDGPDLISAAKDGIDGPR